MIPKLLVTINLDQAKSEIEKILDSKNLTSFHPNLLYFEENQKMGMEQAKKIREHLSTKPYQGLHQAVVLLSADNLSVEAQNSLLKTLEEPPDQALIILVVKSVDALLPTFLSRCQIIYLGDKLDQNLEDKDIKKISELEKGSLEQRFLFMEELEDREEMLPILTRYFREKLIKNSHDQKLIDFMEDLIQAQKWADQNVTIRAILEYLMLKMPKVN